MNQGGLIVPVRGFGTPGGARPGVFIGGGNGVARGTTGSVGTLNNFANNMTGRGGSGFILTPPTNLLGNAAPPTTTTNQNQNKKNNNSSNRSGN